MYYMRNGELVESLPDDFYSTKNYTDAMLEFIEDGRGDGSPFFAYLSYTAVHDPLHAPKEYIDKYRGMYDSGWDDLRQQRLQALKDLGIVPAAVEPFSILPEILTIRSSRIELFGLKAYFDGNWKILLMPPSICRLVFSETDDARPHGLCGVSPVCL